MVIFWKFTIQIFKKYNISESYSEFEEMSNINCRITNAVKCLPPNNKPNSFEIKKCNVF